MFSVKHGELQHLGLLFQRYHRALYRYFYRSLYDQAVSEDLAQLVFERMLKYRSSYSGQGKFTTWMFSIAHNLKIDHYRTYKNEGNLPDHWEDEVYTDTPEPAEKNIKEVHKDLLEQALAELGEDYREIILLSRFEGLRYKEIADILDITEGAVKVRAFRAMKELKIIAERLKKEYYDEEI